MLKKALIIGANGTLGQSLVKTFEKRGYEILGWDKDDCDVSEDSEMDKIVTANPDVVINATAYNLVDKAETEPLEREKAFALNAVAPGRLANTAARIGAVFIHYSTNYVFSGDNPAGYSEDAYVSPINSYGESKAEGEKAVQKVGGKYYLIRLSRLFGDRGTSASSKRTFVEIMLAELDKQTLEVGNVEKSALTYAPDLAELTVDLVSAGRPYGIYHGANAGGCTWAQWAAEIFRLLGRGPEVIPVDHPPVRQLAKHPVNAVLLNTKLPPSRTWQQALAEYLKGR
jgi:dTDP-4-dehydrorhamnose reductase